MKKERGKLQIRFPYEGSTSPVFSRAESSSVK